MNGPLGHRPDAYLMLETWGREGATGMLAMMSKGGICAGQKSIISAPFFIKDVCHPECDLMRVTLRWMVKFQFGLFAAEHRMSSDCKCNPGPLVARFLHHDVRMQSEAAAMRLPCNGGRCCIALGANEFSIKPYPVLSWRDVAWLMNTSSLSGEERAGLKNNCRLGAVVEDPSMHVRYSSVFLSKSVQCGDQLFLAYGSNYLPAMEASGCDVCTSAIAVSQTMCAHGGGPLSDVELLSTKRGRPVGSVKKTSRRHRLRNGCWSAQAH
jgi:hypothetical protein